MSVGKALPLGLWCGGRQRFAEKCMEAKLGSKARSSQSSAPYVLSEGASRVPSLGSTGIGGPLPWLLRLPTVTLITA